MQQRKALLITFLSRFIKNSCKKIIVYIQKNKGLSKKAGINFEQQSLNGQN